jgi:hypothetical protein
MGADWKALSRKCGLAVSGDTIRVPCGASREQVLHVQPAEDQSIRLWSTVVTRGDASRVDNVVVQAWRMNRYRELIGFKCVEHGRIIGECWVPSAGLAADEWLLYVQTLAWSCDRMEYLWTGRDSF